MALALCSPEDRWPGRGPEPLALAPSLRWPPERWERRGAEERRDEPSSRPLAGVLCFSPSAEMVVERRRRGLRAGFASGAAPSAEPLRRRERERRLPPSSRFLPRASSSSRRRLPGVRRTAPASASLSVPVNCEVANAKASPWRDRSSACWASSQASSPTALGRLPSATGSKEARGTTTGLPSSGASFTVSRSTSSSTTLASPSGVRTLEPALGARCLKSL